MKRYCLAVVLINEEALIAEYERLHTQVNPAIISSIVKTGITAMDIYRTGNRLFMIMETNDDFSFEVKNAMDAANPVVQEWEKQVWKYQLALPDAKPGEKWLVMKKIFQL